MGIEAASPPIKELTDSLYINETAETLHEIVSAAERIISAGVEQIALVTIRLFYDKEEKYNSHRLMYAGHTTEYLLNSLRTLVRKTDSVLLLRHSLYFLLPGATKQGGQIVQSRLWEALLWRVHNLSEREMLRPRGMVIGHSAYPTYHETMNDFIVEASKTSLRFDSQPEKATRKTVSVRHKQQTENETEVELPALARKLGVPYLTLLPRKLPQDLHRIVNPKLAQELHCYPLGRERNMLTVAMLNPADRSVLDRLQQETGLQIFPVLTHSQALQVALDQLV